MNKKYKLIVFVATILIFSVFTSVLPSFSNKIPTVINPKASATDYAIIRPDGDVYSGGWSKEGFTYYYENIDDNVIQPADGDDGGYEIYTNLNLKSIKFSLQSHAEIVKSYTVWVRIRTTDTVGSLDTFIDYKYGGGDTYIGQIQVWSSEGEIWDSIQVNNVDKECNNWDLRFRSVAIHPKYIWIDVVYVKIEYYVDDPPITIISPEDTTYTSPMQGYYPATYGFENESEGSMPNHWVKSTPGYGADAYIVNEVNNRKKCLKLHDPSAWIWYPFIPFYTYVEAANSFENQRVGSIEFWLLMPFHWTRTYIFLKDYSTGVDVIALRLQSSASVGLDYFHNGMYWPSGNYFSTSIVAGYWYQFKIDFDLIHEYWKFTMMNGVAEDTTQRLPLSNDATFINGIVFSTEDVDADYDVYIDAIGYSWDPYYDVGDNKYEGLFLEYTPSDLDLMTLTFNGQERKIYGDMVLPMPKSGDYSMRISGYDDSTEYLSDIRYFTVDYSEKIFIVFYASDLPEPEQTWIGATSESFENSLGIYANAIYSKGYRKFYYFRDVDIISALPNYLYTFDGILALFQNKRVDENDEVFIYIAAHGSSYGTESIYGISFLNGYDHGTLAQLESEDFHIKINDFVEDTQNNKIGILIESCFSGYYKYFFDMYEVPAYLITSCQYCKSISWYDPTFNRWYGIFSADFWEAVANGNYNARGAFEYAKYHNILVTPRNPQEYPEDPDDYYIFFN